MIEPRVQFGISVGSDSIGAFGGHGDVGFVARNTFEVLSMDNGHWNGTLNQQIFNLAVVSVPSDLPIFPEEC